MSNDRQFDRLVQEVDFVLAEKRHLRARGVHLLVTHLDHLPGTICAPGEMIGDIAIGGRPGPASLGLTHMSLLLTDCLLRYRVPLSAARIEQIMNTDPFYVRYAENRIGQNQAIARPDRRSVRTYVRRIWKQMEKVFQRMGLAIDPHRVLVSEITDSNLVVYRLKATFEVVHIDKCKIAR